MRAAVRARAVVALALLAAAVAAFFASGAYEQLSFENIKAREQDLEDLYGRRPALVLGLFFLGYVLLGTTSLPGGAAATIAAGAVFGIATATLVISFASSIGATFAFLLSRFVLRDWIERRFGARLQRLNDGVRRDGALYLFMLRLVPAIPFFLVNVGMGLTRMPTWTYYWVSQLGMLAGTLLFANAGSRLAEMESPSDAFSPGVVGAFVALGVLPITAKKAYDALRRRATR
jgi:uncharacterized membrane protein YdjX (TVP38/TMEM64 family)